MMEMRELAEQVKFPLLALQLELLRIEIDNEHIAEVTSSLSQSVVAA